MPQNCESSYRGMESSYSPESRELGSTNHVVSHHIDMSTSKNLPTDSTNGNCNLFEDKSLSRRDFNNDTIKISGNSHHQESSPSRSGHLIPSKKIKLNGDSCINTYPDGKTVDEKAECLMNDCNRKMPHPMAPVDVNRVKKSGNKIGSHSGPINSSIYPYMTDSKGSNSSGYNSESLYSVNHTMKSYQSSVFTNSSSSSGQENHSPSPPGQTDAANTLPIRSMANLTTMSHAHNYRNGYIKPSTSQLINRSRSDNAVSLPEISPLPVSHSSSSPCETLTMSNSHDHGTINGTTIAYSSASSSSSCSSVEKILPMINVVSINNEAPYKEQVPNVCQGEEIMIISNIVEDYSNPHLYPTSSKDYPISTASSTEQRRARYKETWDFLNKSDLIEVTLKTADLLKRNQMLQRDIDLLKEEVAKIIPNGRVCDENQLELSNVCIENSA